jgi:plasmid stability protein
MTDVLIRNLDERVLERLKARAARHGRSLQAEAKWVLERAAGPDREELAEMLARWRSRFEGRGLGDSSDLIREDRDR